MLEEHSNKINLLLDGLIARLDHAIENYKAELTPMLAECIINLYVLKSNMNQQSSKGNIELRIMKNLDDMFKGYNERDTE